MLVGVAPEAPKPNWPGVPLRKLPGNSSGELLWGIPRDTRKRILQRILHPSGTCRGIPLESRARKVTHLVIFISLDLEQST
jgi:hypothetical protein